MAGVVNRKDDALSVGLEDEFGVMSSRQLRIYDDAVGEIESRAATGADVAVPGRAPLMVAY